MKNACKGNVKILFYQENMLFCALKMSFLLKNSKNDVSGCSKTQKIGSIWKIIIIFASRFARNDIKSCQKTGDILNELVRKLRLCANNKIINI